MITRRYAQLVIACLLLTLSSAQAQATPWSKIKKMLVACVVFGAGCPTNFAALNVRQDGTVAAPNTGSVSPPYGGLLMYVHQSCLPKNKTGLYDRAGNDLVGDWMSDLTLALAAEDIAEDGVRFAVIEKDGTSTPFVHGQATSAGARRAVVPCAPGESTRPPLLVSVQVEGEHNLTALVQRMQGGGQLIAVELDYLLYPSLASMDPIATQQWAIKSMNMPAAWRYEEQCRGSSVILAIADTGINSDHEDLRDNLLRDEDGKIVGYNFADSNDDLTDSVGHGTHVAGVAMRSANGVGGVGLSAKNRIKIMPLKVMRGSESFGSLTHVIEALRYASSYARNNRVTVVLNLSLGYFGSPSRIFETEIKKAIPYVIVVAAAGNEGVDVAGNYPAAYTDVLAVGALTEDGERAEFSNYGKKVDVSAPGVNILSTFIGSASEYAYMSGTSMASPQVAMIIALSLGRETGVTVENLRELMPQLTSAIISDQPMGGQINALAVMEALKCNENGTNSETGSGASHVLPQTFVVLSAASLAIFLTPFI